MKRIIITALSIASLTYYAGCTSSKSSEDSSLKEKEVYSFDEAGTDSSAPLPLDSAKVKASINKTRKKSVDTQESPSFTPPVSVNENDTTAAEAVDSVKVAKMAPVIKKETGYRVQLGAFQYEDNAKAFVKKNKAKVNGELSINFNERLNLFMVQLPAFETRAQAMEVVKGLKKKGFKDIFVVKAE